MLAKLQRISMDQWFFISAFVLSLLLSFMAGYVVFRYWELEICKAPMVIKTIEVS